MKKIALILLSMLMIVPFFVGCKEKKETVVIYSSLEDYRGAALDAQLKEKFPDLDVSIQQIATGNNAAKIKAEGTNTEADIVLGLETASVIPLLDNFADISSYKKDHFDEAALTNDGRYRIWERAEGAFVVNTNVLKEKNLPEPATYEDLLKPEYKGLIAMPNPKTSNTGYMFLNNWANIMGKDEAFSYIEKLQVNIKQFTESGSGPVKLLLQGEIAVGLGMVFQAADQITKNAPIKIIQPQTGAPYNTTSFGVIKGKETKESVKRVFTYLNDEFIRYDKENFVPGKVLKEQKTLLKNYPTLTPAKMGDMNSSTLKADLLASWKY
ncbi:MAG: extracellular solute-binding protein [Oscillospiraceae bacterium]